MLKAFKSTEEFEIKGRGISKIIPPENYGKLTFGELEAIIKDKEPVAIDCQLYTILGYEYFAIYREPEDQMHFPVGLLVQKIDVVCSSNNPTTPPRCLFI